MKHKDKKTEPKSNRKVGEWTNRGFLNTKDDRAPIPNQEGIGSGRRRVSVGSTYNMI